VQVEPLAREDLVLLRERLDGFVEDIKGSSSDCQQDGVSHGHVSLLYSTLTISLGT
jgi:hypothetical protein